VQRRIRIAVGVAIALSVSAACVDLFHSTDYDTLCTLNPSACVPDASVDGPTSDGPAALPDVQIPQVDFCTFSQEDARSFRRRLGRKKLSGAVTTCDAIVVGGGTRRSGEKLHYGVKLDMRPFE